MPPRPRDAHDALVDARDQLRRFRLITSGRTQTAPGDGPQNADEDPA